jgi:hypothetical protein
MNRKETLPMNSRIPRLALLGAALLAGAAHAADVATPGL